MTTYYAANNGSLVVGNDANNGLSAGAPKTIQGAWAAASDGDTIIVDVSTSQPYWNTGTTRFNFDKSVTIKAASKGAYDSDPLNDGLGPLLSRFTRLVTFNGLFGTSIGSTKVPRFEDIKWSCDIWPSSTSVPFSDSGIGWEVGVYPYLFTVMGATQPQFEGCEMMYGYGPEGFAPYDPNREYDEYRSPAFWGYNGVTGAIESRSGPAGGGVYEGHGDSTWLPYNHIGSAPGWIYCLNGGSYQEVNCYLHDITGNVHYVQDNVGGAEAICKFSWIERFYIDQLQMAIAGGEAKGQKIHGCVIRTTFGHGLDSGNPHSDTSQHRSAPAAPSKLQLGMEMSNSIIDYSDGRSNAQGCFWGSDNDNALTHAAKLRNNLFIHVNKMFEGGGIDQCYIRNCIAYTPATKASRQGAATITGNKNAGPVVSGNTKSYIKNVIAESHSGTAPWTKLNELLIGKAGAVIPLTDVFTNPNATPFTSPTAAFANSVPKGAYSSYALPYSNARDLITAAYDFTGETVFLGIADADGVAKSATVTSDLIYVHGGDVGDSLTISVSAGIQWRCVAADRVTQISGYTGSSGTIQVGQYAQFQRTSSSTGADTQAGTITLAGVAFPWNVTTRSDNAYPRAAIVSSKIRRTAVGLVGGNTSPARSIFARFKVSDIAANYHRFAAWRAGYGHLASYASSLEFNNYNVAGEAVGGLGYYNGYLNTTDTIELHISINADAADWSSAVRYYKDGSASSPNTTTFNAGKGPISLVEAASLFTLFGRIDADSDYWIGDFSCFAMWKEFIDWSDGAKRARTLPDNIGPNGEGVTGTAPLIFVVGKAAELESANANRGTGGTMTRTGSVISAVSGDGQIWPPRLNLFRVQQTVLPVVGQPADVLLHVGQGWCDAVTVTCATNRTGSFVDSTMDMPNGSSGVVAQYIPGVAGPHTISFTNNKSYVNPPDLVVSVEEHITVTCSEDSSLATALVIR